MSGQNLRVLVVWEPILPTDWRKPTTGTLSRISDPRAEQFWDPGHLVSREIQSSLAADHIAFRGHTSGGDLWDLAVLYSPAESFRNAPPLPAPEFIDGPVVDVAGQLSKAMQEGSSRPASGTEPHSGLAWGLIRSSR